MLRRRESRLGVGGAIAAIAILALLAAGFGLLGGRPAASPSSGAGSDVAVAPSASESVPSGPARTPLVTPASACGAEPVAPPDVLLVENDDEAVPGTVELVETVASRPPATGPPEGTGLITPHVNVRADVVTELWIFGDGCALGWHIDLYDPEMRRSYLLDLEPNPDRDPTWALQNHFRLSGLPPYRYFGRDLQLRAVLTFPSLVIRASWAIRVLPLPWPDVRFGGDRAIPIVPGCDLIMQFGNGWSEGPPGPGCGDDVSDDLPPPSRVRPGELLELSFDGWSVTDAMVICGHMDGRSFVAEPKPGCWNELHGTAAFPAPDEGGWTMQIGGCATQDADRSNNSVCGTWYANVEVR